MSRWAWSSWSVMTSRWMMVKAGSGLEASRVLVVTVLLLLLLLLVSFRVCLDRITNFNSSNSSYTLISMNDD